jgi:hypothetical protein
MKDGLRVDLLTFRVGKAKVRGLFGDDDRETKDELGILRIKLTNVTEVKKIDYRSPNNDNPFRESPHLEDEFDNKYSLRSFSGMTFKMAEGTDLRGQSAINPENAREDVLAFELPVKKATNFVLHLPAEFWGGKGSLKVSFPRELK